MKNLLTTILVISFISIAVFGLFSFSHNSSMPEKPMVNCPYAENGYAVCSNTFDHIKNWQQFSNIIVPSLFVFSLILLGAVLLIFNKRNLLKQNNYFYRWRYYLKDNKKLFTYREKIIEWLSLFENSPSLSY